MRVQLNHRWINALKPYIGFAYGAITMLLTVAVIRFGIESLEKMLLPLFLDVDSWILKNRPLFSALYTWQSVGIMGFCLGAFLASITRFYRLLVAAGFGFFAFCFLFFRDTGHATWYKLVLGLGVAIFMYLGNELGERIKKVWRKNKRFVG